MKKLLLTVTLALNIILAETTKIESLSEIGSTTKYAEGKSFLDKELRGIKSKSPFGILLPEWISTKQLNGFLNPKNNMGNNTLLGLKEWRKNKHTFVAIGCYSKGKVDKKELPYCGHWDGDMKISLSVLEHKEGKTNVLATVQEPKFTTSWENSQLNGGAEDTREEPSNYIKFDFAPYKVSKKSYAFGLRVGWFSLVPPTPVVECL